MLILLTLKLFFFVGLEGVSADSSLQPPARPMVCVHYLSFQVFILFLVKLQHVSPANCSKGRGTKSQGTHLSQAASHEECEGQG